MTSRALSTRCSGACRRGPKSACETPRARWRSSRRASSPDGEGPQTQRFEHEHEFVETRPLPAIVKVFPYGVSRNRLERAIKELRVPAYITKDVNDSNVIITLKTHEKKNIAMLQEAKRRNLPMYVIKSNTYAQIAGVMRDVFHLGPSNEEEDAITNAEEAIERLMETGEPQELEPQSSFLRRLQHQLVEKYDLTSESVGTEPYRRVRIFKS